MRNLRLYNTEEGDDLRWQQDPASFTLGTPAIKFLIDFDRMDPVAVSATTTVDELRSIMLNTQLRLAPVKDAYGHFIGIISFDDLSDQRLLQKQAEGTPRRDLKVSDLMIRRRDLIAFDALEVAESTIADVIWAMKKNGQSYCLMLEREAHTIHGVFSASDISEKLRLPVNIDDRTSFYRVFAPVSVATR